MGFEDILPGLDNFMTQMDEMGKKLRKKERDDILSWGRGD